MVSSLSAAFIDASQAAKSDTSAASIMIASTKRGFDEVATAAAAAATTSAAAQTARIAARSAGPARSAGQGARGVAGISRAALSPPSRPRPGRMGFVRKRPKRPTLRFVAL